MCIIDSYAPDGTIYEQGQDLDAYWNIDAHRWYTLAQNQTVTPEVAPAATFHGYIMCSEFQNANSIRDPSKGYAQRIQNGELTEEYVEITTYDTSLGPLDVGTYVQWIEIDGEKVISYAGCLPDPQVRFQLEACEVDPDDGIAKPPGF